MRCADMAEFVSATLDGEPVPQDAAEHIARCAQCQVLLSDYAGAGAALRRYSAAELAQPLAARTWVQPKRRAAMLWEKGWERMRVPRIAFVSLVVLLVAVVSRLALVEVRAHEDGSVLLLHLATGPDESMTCPLSLTDPRGKSCSGVTDTSGGNLAYGIRLLRKEGDHVVLGVITELGRSGSFSPDEIQSLATTQYTFTPGETLQFGTAGQKQMAATGEWTDHIPALPIANQELDPAANELRLASPLLLKEDHVAGDMKGATAIANQADHGVFLYLPGEGRFEFSLTPGPGAVPGQVEFNRVSFESNGQPYVVVTGTPIARAQRLWVKHDPKWKPREEDMVQHGMVGAL